MADAKADKVLVNGTEVAENFDGINFRFGLTASNSNGVVNVNPTGLREIAVAETNGTTAVSVFGASGLPYAVTITGVFVIAKDTTAGNITVENPASTVVCTIAKGTVAGVLVGATSLANTAVAAGTNLVVDSSTTGNASVFITYTRA